MAGHGANLRIGSGARRPLRDIRALRRQPAGEARRPGQRLVHRAGGRRPVPGRIQGRGGAGGTSAPAAPRFGQVAAGGRTRRAGRRQGHYAQPDCQGIAGHPSEAPAGVLAVRGSPGGAGGSDRYVADRHDRRAFASRKPPSSSDRPGRARSDPDPAPLHPVRAARGGLGIRTVARRKPVHGYGRPGGAGRGRQPAGSSDTADADKLAHLVRRGDGFGQVDRCTGAGRHAAAGARLVSRGRFRPGAPQPPTGRGR